MTRFIATLALALSTLATVGGHAHAQDTLDELREHCATLEAVQSPAVLDCAQAVADAENATSDEDAQAIVDSYARGERPYDFDDTVTAYAQNGRTLFDGE